jgi:hypothetical protein
MGAAGKSTPSGLRSPASRANASSTEGVPGEALFTPLSSHTPWRSFIHAALQGAYGTHPLQKLFAQQVVDLLRIGFALGRFHRLTD